MSVVDLWLPTLLSAVALFVASFLSWMVVQLHKRDWGKIDQEDAFLKSAGSAGLKRGSYMFPCCANAEEMKSEAFAKKWEAGPCGVITVFPKVSMGRNLALTFVYFLVVSFCLGYLATLAMERGATFMEVFRFVSTAGVLVFLAAMVQHAIWFHNRIVGHVIESVVYAAITAAIFAAMWPA